MTFLGAATRIILLAASGFLTSCIDGREEVWLDSSGGGRAEITYSLPAAAARMHGGVDGIRAMISDFLDQTPEITSSACEVTGDEKRLLVTISASFDSALDLKNIADGPSIHRLPNAASHLAGIVNVDFSGRTVDFSRTIFAGKALPGSAFLPASQFEGRRMVYIMHLPDAATDSNATRTEDAGRTLIWDIPLTDALKAPVITRFRMDIPIPWKLVSSIAIPVSLAGGFFLLRLRKPKLAVA